MNKFTIPALLILIGTLWMASCKTQQVTEAPKPPKANLSHTEADITEGETYTLTWSSDADTVILHSNGTDKILTSKQTNLSPDKTTNYMLTFTKNGLETKKNFQLTVKPKPVIRKPKYNVSVKKEKHLFSTGDSDGRFTIGTADGKRLMYGYPIPASTSHIILKVDDAFASNYPGFKTKYDTVYFTGKTEAKGKKGSITLKTELMLDSVFITQSLTPVSKDLKPLKEGEFGQYYLISYKITNESKDSKNVGFMTLLDLMIDNNDAPKSYFGNNMIGSETGFSGNNIPERFKTLHVKGAMTGFASETILEGGEATKPDRLYIGRWSPFHGFVWDVETNNKPYGDSGYLLKWNEKDLAAGDSLTYAYYYGLPFNGQIRAIPSSKNVKTKQVTVYFKSSGSSYLDKKAKHSIDSLLTEGANFYGGIIEGYGDATGSDAMNIKISEKRISSIIKYLRTKGIDKNTLIPKPYGEAKADQSEEAEKKGNPKDRKAKITLYIEER